jgi:hypothetical protein
VNRWLLDAIGRRSPLVQCSIGKKCESSALRRDDLQEGELMKRSPELRDLSEEHHYGLVASRQLRLAAASSEPLDQPVAAFLRAWREEIEPHFRTEEAVLLPRFAQVTGVETSLIDRTLAEHAVLRVAVLELAAATGDDQRFLATRAAELLHDHIRFEERVLFPEIERQLEGAPLRLLGVALGAARSHVPRCTVPVRSETQKDSA